MERPNVKISYKTSSDDIINEFFLPCLKWANKFERGVGYFTSGWIEYNAEGMAEFVSHGGIAKWIVSPIIEKKDFEVFLRAVNGEKEEYINRLVELGVEKLMHEMRENTQNLFAWMIHDRVLEMKFAVPMGDLLGGDFHDKFGNFYGENDEVLSFTGSMNDSKKGFINYEGIFVFESWAGGRAYTEIMQQKFEDLWKNTEANIKCYNMSEAVKNKIFTLRRGERPYNLPHVQGNKWSHQDEAIDCFLKQNNGILEMATGTGKTYTAIRIAQKLLSTKEIKKVIVCTYGNDLLEQWYKELLVKLEGIRVFRFYETNYKQLVDFYLCDKPCVLVLSLNIDRVLETTKILTENYDRVFWIFDEVHRLGALSFRKNLKGILEKFKYRLGLSATPLREFDEEGNSFIQKEIGDVIFRFDIKTAIIRGILCEFRYVPLEYELTEAEKRRKRDIIASFEARKAKGEIVDEESMYRELSRVNKLSVSKLPLFEKLILEKPGLLDNSIIFVESMEYGEKVQDILSKYIFRYHTYYAEDQKKELQKFGKGEIDCLLTCKKISEGVDIKSVRNIFLFSSDRGKLVTTQRIGRSLRISSEDPDKKSNIIDFICITTKDSLQEEIQADKERREWLEDLASTRRMK